MKVFQVSSLPPTPCQRKKPFCQSVSQYYSILAWRIPWTEEPGRLQSMGLEEVDLATKPPPQSESRSAVSDSLEPHGLYRPWNSPGQNTGVRSLFLLQGIFPGGIEPGSPAFQWILYQLSYEGSFCQWISHFFSGYIPEMWVVSQVIF